MQRIYLDNAATSWPKPNSVYEAVDAYQRANGAPAGRGGYHEATETQRLVSDARRRLAELIGAASPNNIVFAFNGTDALNIVLHGLLTGNDGHVVTTVAEHNSVLRPLRYWERTDGCEVTRVPCDASGVIDAGAIEAAIRPNTKLIAIVHGSNVTGAIQPCKAIGEIAKKRDIPFLVDAAQTLGRTPIQVDELHADFLAAPGHKGLHGPLGTGVLYVRDGLAERLQPFRLGGTGTQSDEDHQPDTMPEKLEAGNLNVPGIVGLRAGLIDLESKSLGEVRDREIELTARLLEGMRPHSNVSLFGPSTADERLGVVSFNIEGYDPREVADLLDSSYGIQCRAGIHCAPLMHAALGTLESGGTVRFSVGLETTDEEIRIALEAVAEIASA